MSLIVILALIALFGVGLIVFGVMQIKAHYRENQQVVPGIESAAPIDWVGSHEPEAKLHRRLVSAMAGVRSATVGNENMAETVRALGTDVTKLEKQLVASSALTEERRTQVLAEIDRGVSEVETLAADLLQDSATRSTEELHKNIAEVQQRLQLLQEASAELG